MANATASADGHRLPPRLTRTVIAAAVVAGAGAGTAIALLRAGPGPVPQASSGAVAVWSAGSHRAPDFRLRDQNDQTISLRSLRGRPILLTFIDPLCRTLCPLEARVLGNLVRSLAPSERPVVVAVSVNPSGDGRANLHADAEKWRLPADWRWALGRHADLAPVWGHYQIDVRMRTTVLAGVTVRDVNHAEATYVVDKRGFQRALYLYPFHPEDVKATLRLLQSEQ